MADQVSSMFLDQGLLGMLPKEQAERAANQATMSFWMNLIGSGNPGQAWNSAQQAGYNTVNHAIQLQQHQLNLSEAARKARDTATRQQEQQDAFTRTFVRGANFDEPGAITGIGGMGPAYIANEKFDPIRFATALARRGIANNEDLKVLAPNNQYVRGVRVDPNDPNAPAFIPEMPTGMDQKGNLVGNVAQSAATLKAAEEGGKANFDFVPVTLPDGSQVMMSKAALAAAQAQGKPVVSANPPKVSENIQLYTDPKTGQLAARPVPGAPKAVSALAGSKASAEESARANLDVVPVQMPDGTTINVTRAQAAAAAKTGQPLVQNIGPQATAERTGAGKFNIEQVLTPAKTAADAAQKSNTNLAILSTTLKNTPLNQITATDSVQKLAGYAKAAGMLSPEAAANVSNLTALRGLISGSVLQEQLAQKGPQTESDAKRMTDTISAMGDKDATQFLINAKMAQNKRTQEYYAHLDEYRRKTGTLDGADEAWGSGKGKQSIFRAPEMRQYAEQRRGNDGKLYYYFGDGGEAILVPQKGK